MNKLQRHRESQLLQRRNSHSSHSSSHNNNHNNSNHHHNHHHIHSSSGSNLNTTMLSFSSSTLIDDDHSKIMSMELETNNLDNNNSHYNSNNSNKKKNTLRSSNSSPIGLESYETEDDNNKNNNCYYNDKKNCYNDHDDDNININNDNNNEEEEEEEMFVLLQQELDDVSEQEEQQQRRKDFMAFTIARCRIFWHTMVTTAGTSLYTTNTTTTTNNTTRSRNGNNNRNRSRRGGGGGGSIMNHCFPSLSSSSSSSSLVTSRNNGHGRLRHLVGSVCLVALFCVAMNITVSSQQLYRFTTLPLSSSSSSIDKKKKDKESSQLVDNDNHGGSRGGGGGGGAFVSMPSSDTIAASSSSSSSIIHSSTSSSSLWQDFQSMFIGIFGGGDGMNDQGGEFSTWEGKTRNEEKKHSDEQQQSSSSPPQQQQQSVVSSSSSSGIIPIVPNSNNDYHDDTQTQNQQEQQQQPLSNTDGTITTNNKNKQPILLGHRTNNNNNSSSSSLSSSLKLPPLTKYKYHPDTIPSRLGNTSTHFLQRWCDFSSSKKGNKNGNNTKDLLLHDWYVQHDPTMSWQRRAPAFLIPGVKYTGATRILSQLLSQHEQILPPNGISSSNHQQQQYDVQFFLDFNFRKYVSYYTQITNVQLARQHLYAHLFYNKKILQYDENKISFDSTNGYLLYSTVTPRRIFCVTPWVKLIIILQDPIHRLIRHYIVARKQYGLPLSFQEWIEKDWQLMQRVGLIPNHHNNNNNSSSTRTRTILTTEEEDEAWYDYTSHSQEGAIGRGMYEIQLRHWFQALLGIGQQPKRVVLLLWANDFGKEPKGYYKRVLQFVGVNSSNIAIQNAILSKNNKNKKNTTNTTTTNMVWDQIQNEILQSPPSVMVPPSKRRRRQRHGRYRQSNNKTQNNINKVPIMSQEFRKRLQDFYQPYQERLPQMLRHYGVTFATPLVD